MADLADDAAGQLQQASTQLARAGVRTSITLVGKATRISAYTASSATGVVVRALVALLDAARGAAGIRRGEGQVRLRRFTQLAEGKREVVPIKDAEVARQLSRELRRHGVTFAIERNADKTLTFHVQGKDAGLIEHALTQASIRVDERIKRAHERTGDQVEDHSDSVEQETETETLRLDAAQKSDLGEAIRASAVDERSAELADVVERDGTIVLTQENIEAIDAALTAKPELHDLLPDVVAAVEDERSTIAVSEAVEADDSFVLGDGWSDDERAAAISLLDEVDRAEDKAKDAVFAAESSGDPDWYADASKHNAAADVARAELRDRYGIELPSEELKDLIWHVANAESDASDASFEAEVGIDPDGVAREAMHQAEAVAARAELQARYGIDLSHAAGNYTDTHAAVKAELDKRSTDAARMRLQEAEHSAVKQGDAHVLDRGLSDDDRVTSLLHQVETAERDVRDAHYSADFGAEGPETDTALARAAQAEQVADGARVELKDRHDIDLSAAAGDYPATRSAVDAELSSRSATAMRARLEPTVETNSAAAELERPTIERAPMSQRDATRERVAADIDTKVGHLKDKQPEGPRSSKFLQRDEPRSPRAGR